jgi:hypothetical protein
MLKNLLPHLIRLDQEQMDQEQMATDKVFFPTRLSLFVYLLIIVSCFTHAL